MNITQLIEKLKQFPPNATVLVHNGTTLCAIDNVAQFACDNDPDDGAAVIYLEE